jgi:tetratricopeptide (TPR) repeat protein
MIALLLKPIVWLREHPLATLMTLTALVILGVGVRLVVSQVSAEYHYQKAEQALERSVFADRDANLSTARQHLDACLAVRGDSADTHLLAARAARRAQAYDDAEMHLQRCKQLGGVPQAIDLEWALLHAQRGEMKSGEEQVLEEDVARDHPDSVLILEALARGYAKTYRLTEAVRCLTHRLEIQPENAQVLLDRAALYQFTNSEHDSFEDYARAYELDSQNEQARRGLADALVYFHRARQADEHYQFLLTRHPDDVSVLRGLARCKMEEEPEDLADARPLLEQALALESANGSVLAERGRLEMLLGRPSDAESWLRRAVELTPYERMPVYQLSLCLQQLGHTQEAEKLRTRVDAIDRDLERLKNVTRQIMLSPQDADLRFEAGQILLRNGQEEGALGWFNSALRINPRHKATCRALADYFARKGDAIRAAKFRELAGDTDATSAESQ